MSAPPITSPADRLLAEAVRDEADLTERASHMRPRAALDEAIRINQRMQESAAMRLRGRTT